MLACGRHSLHEPRLFFRCQRHRCVLLWFPPPFIHKPIVYRSPFQFLASGHLLLKEELAKIRTSKAQECKGRIEGKTQERRKMTVNGSKDFFKKAFRTRARVRRGSG